MDSAKCNVIYVDRNASQDRVYGPPANESDTESDLSESRELRNNLDLLANAFGVGELSSYKPYFALRS